jgi:uncharacterized protein YceK
MPPLGSRSAAALALSLLAALAACGTAHTRAGRSQNPENGYFFGTPLYAAVAYDGVLFWEGSHSGPCIDLFGIERVGALLCLPVDLVLDTVFLPLDLLSAAFGHSKTGTEREVADPPRSSAAAERIRAASIPELERWADAVLSARNLDEVMQAT